MTQHFFLIDPILLRHKFFRLFVYHIHTTPFLFHTPPKSLTFSSLVFRNSVFLWPPTRLWRGSDQLKCDNNNNKHLIQISCSSSLNLSTIALLILREKFQVWLLLLLLRVCRIGRSPRNEKKRKERRCDVTTEERKEEKPWKPSGFIHSVYIISRGNSELRKDEHGWVVCWNEIFN